MYALKKNCTISTYMGGSGGQAAPAYTESAYSKVTNLVACKATMGSLQTNSMQSGTIVTEKLVIAPGDEEELLPDEKLVEIQGDVFISGVIDPTGMQLTSPPDGGVPKKQSDGTDYTNSPNQGLLYVSDADPIGAFSNKLVFQDGSNVSHVLGDMLGPAAPTTNDTSLALFDGTTGRKLQDSNVMLDNSSNTFLPVVPGENIGMSTTGSVVLTGTTIDLNGTVYGNDLRGILLEEQTANPFPLQTSTQGAFYVKQGGYGSYVDNHPVYAPTASTESVIGNVIGPDDSSPVGLHSLVRFDDTQGRVVKQSDVTLTDTNELVAVAGNLGLAAPNGNISISTHPDQTILVDTKSMTVTGNFVVNGTSVSIDSVTLNVMDNYAYLNKGHVIPSFESFGLVGNYLPTTQVVSVAGPFTPGAGIVNPTVVTSASGVFVAGDLVQISGSAVNDGLYEVESHTSSILEIKGPLANPIDFAQNQFQDESGGIGTITKINVAAISFDTSARPVLRYGLNTSQPTIATAKHFLSSATAGTGISIDLTDPVAPVISNTDPGSAVSVVPLTDDVQITEAPTGQFNLNIGHTASAANGSIIVAGQTDYLAANLGSATNTLIIGKGDTSLNYTAGQCATALGYNAGRSPAGIQTTAVGCGAGKTGQGNNAVAVGFSAGDAFQGSDSIAVGKYAGQYNQGASAVAIGHNAAQGTLDGLNSQGASSVAIGHLAATTKQGAQSVAIGYQAGQTNQGTHNVAIGYRAGLTNQTFGSAFNQSVAIGYDTGRDNQGQLSVAVGAGAGRDSQSAQSVAVGVGAGTVTQGYLCVAMGNGAGKYTQKQGAISIGNVAGSGEGPSSTQVGFQDINSIAIGSSAAQYGQGQYAIALGHSSGQGSSTGLNLQGIHAAAIGTAAGQLSQGAHGVAVGYQAAMTTQGSQSVAVGYQAGKTNQGVQNVAIGYRAGESNQANTGFQQSVAIGSLCGLNAQGQLSVAIGVSAAQESQGPQSVAIGRMAGNYLQGSYCVAIGDSAGKYNQKNFGVAIGINAASGVSGTVGFQDISGIAIGNAAAQYGQGTGAIALGAGASIGAVDGSTPQPARSVAIGYSCATPGNVGRLAFGNAMEFPLDPDNSNLQAPVKLLNLEWNSVLYKVPLLAAGATGLVSSVNATLASTGGTSLISDGTGPAMTLYGLSAGTGVSITPGPLSISIANTAPDQTVVLNAGTGMSVSGTYPNFTVTNAAPDQTVVLNAGTGMSVSGTYPNFTVTNSDRGSSVSLSSAGGTSLVSDGIGPALTMYGLSAGFGISLTQNANDIEIKNVAFSNVASSMGEVSYTTYHGFTMPGPSGTISPVCTLKTSEDIFLNPYFAQPSFGQLQYLGTEPFMAQITVTVGAYRTVANEVWRFEIHKNAAPITDGVHWYSTKNTSDDFTINLSKLIDMVQNDTLSVACFNETSSTVLQISAFILNSFTTGFSYTNPPVFTAGVWQSNSHAGGFPIWSTQIQPHPNVSITSPYTIIYVTASVTLNILWSRIAGGGNSGYTVYKNGTPIVSAANIHDYNFNSVCIPGEFFQIFSSGIAVTWVYQLTISTV